MLYTVGDGEAGLRLDVFLSGKSGASRSAIQRACDEGLVLVSGIKREKKYTVKSGDAVEYTEQAPEEYSASPENIPLDIVYEDSDIIVINKPKGMVVHPAAGNPSGTLVNALLYHCGDSLSGIGGVLRPGIVHRIDKDTTGLLVAAKNDFSHMALSRELEHHGIVREYHALVSGGFAEEQGTVNLPIGRHPRDRKKMAVHLKPSSSSKEAITHYEVIRTYPLEGGKVSYLKLRLETGRTHQIRVHMSHGGHPLLGDEVYGGGRTKFERAHGGLLSGQALHAKKLILTHPRTGERMEFESELPAEFSKLLQILESTEI